MHSDGPDCGCWNLIYGTCSASDRQPMGSGQVCARVCVGGCVWVLSFSSVFVSLSVYLSSVCVCVCVCVQSGGG